MSLKWNRARFTRLFTGLKTGDGFIPTGESPVKPFTRTSIAERDTKREQGSPRGAELCANDLWGLAHLFPDLNRHRIHIKQSKLLATLSPNAIHTYLRQEGYLSRLEKVRHHADGWRILNVLDVIRTLRNDLVVQIREGSILGKAAQNI